MVTVCGTGAEADPIPPAERLYQSRFDPAAVKGTAVAYWLYATGEITEGAGGVAVMFTTTGALTDSHPDV